ncbi:hypothetical protein CR513_15731, partial [Mucuna pruriens]
MVRIVTLVFGDYPFVWWTQMLEEIRIDVIDPCENCVYLKRIMRKTFVPPSYMRNLHNKLQRLYQGTKSVEEYHKEMDMNLMKAQIRETGEATMDRFLHGLNKEIQEVMELQHYGTLGELVHQAIKVEMHLGRPIGKDLELSNTYGASSGWNGKEKEKEKEKVRREKSPKQGSRKDLAIIHTPNPPRTSSIKCFKCLGKGHRVSQCPNRRAMVLRDNGEVESESSRVERSSSSEVKTSNEESHYEGDLLMVALLVMRPRHNENIFHSRYLVLGNLCSMIIDGGSCVNVASRRLVEKLALPTFAYLRPYKLQWLSEKGELLVDKQVEVPSKPSFED